MNELNLPILLFTSHTSSLIYTTKVNGTFCLCQLTAQRCKAKYQSLVNGWGETKCPFSHNNVLLSLVCYLISLRYTLYCWWKWTFDKYWNIGNTQTIHFISWNTWGILFFFSYLQSNVSWLFLVSGAGLCRFWVLVVLRFDCKSTSCPAVTFMVCFCRRRSSLSCRCVMRSEDTSNDKRLYMMVMDAHRTFGERNIRVASIIIVIINATKTCWVPSTRHHCSPFKQLGPQKYKEIDTRHQYSHSRVHSISNHSE